MDFGSWIFGTGIRAGVKGITPLALGVQGYTKKG